jgi:hypothetical protein
MARGSTAGVGPTSASCCKRCIPQTCAFCMPGGPESLVEVKSKTPVKYTFDAIVMTGKLEVLKDDPTGIFYRLTDATESR